jgi:hypothetical protein
MSMSTIGARRLRTMSSPVILALAAVMCAWFTSRAMAAWGATEPKLASTRALVPVPAPALAPPAEAEPHDSAAFVTRNMFCSSCVAKPDDGAPRPGGGGGAAHTLPRVIATHVGDRGGGWATLEIAGLAGGFMQGATLPGGGVIERVERGAIVVRFADGSERVPLASEADLVATREPARATEPAAKADPWADRVRAIGDNRWEVDRTLIRELVSAGTGGNPAAKGVRLTPVSKDGKLAGVRVATARTGSLASVLGLSSGDVIESIDGRAIDSPEVLMKMYDRLGDLRRVDLGVKRKGQDVTLTYDLP